MAVSSDSAARAFWTVAPGRGEIRDTILPARGPEDVLVRTLCSGISRGTEALVFRGRVPVSQHDAMRAPFQDGHFPAPVKYGYAAVGVVEDGPVDLQGRTVFCLYPHQTRFVVPTAAVVPLPEGVPPGRAVLAANMETAVNGLWDAAPRVGDRIAIIGAGAVGCLVAHLARGIPGAQVQLVDRDRGKSAIAGRLSVPFASPDDAEGDADLVIHASGSPDGAALALRLAGFEATVVELSWFGDALVPLPLGEAFHSKRLTLRSSQVGTVAEARRARRSHRDRLAFALSLLATPDLDHLITGEDAFDDLPEVMARLSAGTDGTICHRIRYEA